MKFLSIKMDEKAKNKVLVIRLVVMLTFIFKTTFVAEGQYNSLSGISIKNMLPFVIIFYGIFSWLIYWLVSNISYNLMARSKYAPVGNDGLIAFNAPTFQANLGLLVIIRNLILGGLNFVAYRYAVSIPIIVVALPRILNIFTVIALFFMLKAYCGKGEGKELLVSMTGSMAALILLLA